MSVIDKLLQESLEAKAEVVRKKIQESLDDVKILGTFKDGAIVLHEGKHYRAYLKDDKVELKLTEESTVTPADIVEDFLSGKPLKKKLDQLIESVAKGTVKTSSSTLKPLIEKLSKLYKDEKEEKEILEAIRVGIRKMKHKIVPASVRAKRKAYYRRNKAKILRAVKQWVSKNERCFFCNFKRSWSRYWWK
jgi:ribosomal protein S19